MSVTAFFLGAAEQLALTAAHLHFFLTSLLARATNATGGSAGHGDFSNESGVSLSPVNAQP